jgi:type I restriction enzyme M protein
MTLDIFWLRDESLESADNLPSPDVFAKSILEDLEATIEKFRAIAGDLGGIEDILEEDFGVLM